MPEELKVPARYVGAHSVLLNASNGPYEDAEGARLESLKLEAGATLKIPAHEAWGVTELWGGPEGMSEIGYGRVVLSHHAKDNPADEVLAAMGYVFILPRADFDALLPPPPPDNEALGKAGWSAVTYDDMRASAAKALKAAAKATQKTSESAPAES